MRGLYRRMDLRPLNRPLTAVSLLPASVMPSPARGEGAAARTGGCALMIDRPLSPLVGFNRQQMVQPRFHGLMQIVVRPAEGGIAAGDELILLALQGAAGARTVARRLVDHLGIHRIDLAVEIGEFRIGAD